MKLTTIALLQKYRKQRSSASATITVHDYSYCGRLPTKRSTMPVGILLA